LIVFFVLKPVAIQTLAVNVNFEGWERGEPGPNALIQYREPGQFILFHHKAREHSFAGRCSGRPSMPKAPRASASVGSEDRLQFLVRYALSFCGGHGMYGAPMRNGSAASRSRCRRDKLRGAEAVSAPLRMWKLLFADIRLTRVTRRPPFGACCHRRTWQQPRPVADRRPDQSESGCRHRPARPRYPRSSL
jgi:hypothetical protein